MLVACSLRKAEDAVRSVQEEKSDAEQRSEDLVGKLEQERDQKKELMERLEKGRIFEEELTKGSLKLEETLRALQLENDDLLRSHRQAQADSQRFEGRVKELERLLESEKSRSRSLGETDAEHMVRVASLENELLTAQVGFSFTCWLEWQSDRVCEALS